MSILGCVCGEIHDERWKLFWIQCEACDSWYDVSEKCVGFSEQDAKNVKGWNCWACPSPQNNESEEDDDHPKDIVKIQDGRPNDEMENHEVSDSVSTVSFPVNISDERKTQDGCILPKSKPRQNQDGEEDNQGPVMRRSRSNHSLRATNQRRQRKSGECSVM